MRCFLAAAMAVLSSCVLYAQDGAQVNPLTGEFNYDINVVAVPGPNGSGYSVNLRYSSEVRVEDEASWVGYGWDLNLPVINRARKGLPDDYKDVQVTLLHKVPDRFSLSVKPWYYAEFLKADFLPSGLVGGPEASLSMDYDSEYGLDLTFGVGVKAKYGRFGGQVNMDDELNVNGGFGVNLSFEYPVTDNSQYRASTPERPGINQPATSSLSLSASTGVSVPFSVTRAPAYFGAPMTGVNLNSTSYQGTMKVGDALLGHEIGVNVLYNTYKYFDRSEKAFGYLYSYGAIAAKNYEALLDYSVEKAGTPEGMSRPYAPTPFPDVDEYSVNAPGIGGTFRAYQRFPLEMFGPKQIVTLTIENQHLEQSFGVPPFSEFSIGIGKSFPSGEMRSVNEPFELGTGGGSLAAITKDLYATEQEPFAFRYIGDRADQVSYASNDDPILGSIEGGMWMGSFHERNRDRPLRTNTFVKPLFSTNATITLPTGVPSTIPDGTIKGFEIVDNAGNEWKFDDRTFVWSDTSMTYVLRNDPRFTRSGLRISYVSKAEGRDPLTYYQEWHGMAMPKAFVESYLATSSTTPDYVDVTGDGPSDDDKGGWTKYTWRTQSNNFRIRSPYCGYFADKGNLDDARDDKLSYTRQNKQLKFIKKIETATHVAEFFTAEDDGKPPRKDAWQAQDETVAQTYEWDKTGSNQNTYLSRIVLYKKTSGGLVPERTTHFSYDYSVQEGNESSQADDVGKLTLKKIWFEDHNVKDAYIEPIQFGYEYPTLVTSGATNASQINVGDLKTRYPAIDVPDFASFDTENPFYNENKTDAWGYYGAEGTRTLSFSSTTFSLPYNPTPIWTTPSAHIAHYRLKRITLPTGAEIVPVYEPRDYGWVQDSTAMAMIPLKSNSRESMLTTLKMSTQLKVAITSVPVAEQDAYVENVKRRFLTNGERLYVRLAYGQKLPHFDSPSARTPAVSSVRSYVKVSNITRSVESGITTLTFDLDNPTGASSSDEVRDLVNHASHLPWSKAILSYQDAAKKNYRPELTGDILNMANDVLYLMVTNGEASGIFPGDDLLAGDYPTLLPTASYMRLPAMRPKQGGGSRVRALYTFNPAGTLQSGDASVTGSLYTYRTFLPNGMASTSGVATQEPIQLREQMGIVQVNPDLLNETRDGVALREVDIARLETPLGESLLPGPMVGHSRVITSSLYTGLTKSQSTVQTFLTTKERPSVQAIPSTRNERKGKYPDILSILADISNEWVEIEQGFTFKVFDGFGAPLSTETYVGREPSTPAVRNPSTGVIADAILAGATYYDYVPAGEDMLLLDTIDRPLRYGSPGAEMDIVTEHKHIEVDRQNLTFEWTVSWSPLFKFIPGVMPKFESHNNHVHSYVTTKVSHKPLYLRRTRTIVDGKIDSTVVVALDAKTGADAIVQGSDGYHKLTLGSVGTPHVGTITNVSVPALRAIPAMGHRSEAEGRVFGKADPTKLQDGYVWTGHCSVSAASNVLTLDLSHITNTTDKQKRIRAFRDLFTVGDEIEVTGSPAFIATVTAIGTTSNAVQLTYTGTTVSGPQDKVKITRSARRNMIAMPLAATSIYGAEFSAVTTHADKLRKRTQWANTFNDWMRAGRGSVGMYWEQPLVRFPAPGAGTPNEDLPYKSTSPTAPPDAIDETTTGQCAALTPSLYEFVVRRDNHSPSPYNYYDGIIEYTSRGDVPVSPPTFPVTYKCDETTVSGYQSVMPKWNRWTLFGVNDKGDLVAGNDFAKADERKTNELFNFRTILYTSGQKSGWDLAVNGTSVPTLSDFDDVISATGIAYATVTDEGRTRPTFRTKASYRAYDPLVEGVVTTGSTEGVWKSSGTFDLASAYVLPASMLSPAAPWRLQDYVYTWNEHGAIREKIGADRIVASTQYGPSGHLPVVQCMGSPAEYVWSYDAEADGTTAAAHTGSKSIEVPYSVATSLPVISDPTVLGTTYTIRMWLKYSCPSSQIFVALEGDGYTGSTLDDALVGAVDDWRLYEFKLPGECSSISVNTYGASPGDAYVDDILIRPTESVATTMVYGIYDEPLAQLDDNGFATVMRYDARGRHIRTSVETIRGHDVVQESGTWLKSYRRQETELAGGGPWAPASRPLLNGYQEVNPGPPMFIPSTKPAGFKAQFPLLDINLTPEKQRVNTMPEVERIIAPESGEKK